MECENYQLDREIVVKEENQKSSEIVDVADTTLVRLITIMAETISKSSTLPSKIWWGETNHDNKRYPDRPLQLTPAKEFDDFQTIEIETLKKSPIKAEDDSISDKRDNNCNNLKGVHEKIETVIVDLADRIIRTINDLSSELINTDETLHRLRDQNSSNKIEIDRLRAMIRVSSGNSVEYRKRISELNNFVLRMDRETWLLKSNHESADSSMIFKSHEERINGVKSLIRELRFKLKNDRKALFTGGNLWWSMYLKKIREMKSCLKNLSLELKVTRVDSKYESDRDEFSKSEGYRKGISTIQELVKRVVSDFHSLAKLPIKIGSGVGRESHMKYYERMKDLEKLATSSNSIVDKLIDDSRKIIDIRERKKFAIFSNSNENIEALETLAKKLKCGIKGLEIVVAAGDGANLTEKIRELEASLKRLKNEMNDKDEEKDSLSLELTGAKIAYDEKSEQLEELRIKYKKIVDRLKKRGESLDYEEKMARLVRELEESRCNEKTIREEVNRLRTEVASVGAEKTILVVELEKLRNSLEAKNDEIVKITRDRRIKERALMKDVSGTETKLANAEKEIAKLKNDLEINEKATRELTNLNKMFNVTKENLEITNNKFIDLRGKFDELVVEKKTIQQELLSLRTQNETLKVRLNSEKATSSKTLKSFEKLNEDFAKLELEKLQLRENLESVENDRNVLRTEAEEFLRKNVCMERETLTLNSQLHNLRQEVEETRQKNRDVDDRTKKLIEENRDLANRLNSLTNDNEKLNDQLDRVRSDKLNITGNLNAAKHECESTKDRLDAKINEVKNLEEKLFIALDDLGKLERKENLEKLEITRLLEENEKFCKTIESSNLERTRLEKRVENTENDLLALENKLAILQSERNDLKSEACMLNRRINELTEETTILRLETEKNVRERSELVDEHEKTLETMREKSNGLENEVARLRDENSSLKRAYDEIARENDKTRECERKRSEINRPRSENETLKFELEKLRMLDPTSKDDEAAKRKLEKVFENIATRILRYERSAGKRMSKDSQRKLEEQLRFWKGENAELRKNLENAFIKIENSNERMREFETEKNMLLGSIEGLKERYKISMKQNDEARMRNSYLDKEISELKGHLETTTIEDSILEQEVKKLHAAMTSVKEENSKTKYNFAMAERELSALKDELTKSRLEIVSLNDRLNVQNSNYQDIATENASLRNELEEARRMTVATNEKNNELRNECEKIATLRDTLESNLTDARIKIDKYVVATAKLNDLENKFRNALRDYVITRKLLRAANEEIHHLRRSVNPYFHGTNYVEKIEATS